MARKPGRPSKFTPEIEAKILEALRAGNYLETAARARARAAAEAAEQADRGRADG